MTSLWLIRSGSNFFSYTMDEGPDDFTMIPVFTQKDLAVKFDKYISKGRITQIHEIDFQLLKNLISQMELGYIRLGLVSFDNGLCRIADCELNFYELLDNDLTIPISSEGLEVFQLPGFTEENDMENPSENYDSKSYKEKNGTLISAKYVGYCKTCGRPIQPSDLMGYNPQNRKHKCFLCWLEIEPPKSCAHWAVSGSYTAIRSASGGYYRTNGGKQTCLICGSSVYSPSAGSYVKSYTKKYGKHGGQAGTDYEAYIVPIAKGSISPSDTLVIPYLEKLICNINLPVDIRCKAIWHLNRIGGTFADDLISSLVFWEDNINDELAKDITSKDLYELLKSDLNIEDLDSVKKALRKRIENRNKKEDYGE